MKNQLNRLYRTMKNTGIYSLLMLFLLASFSAKAIEVEYEQVLEGTNIESQTSYIKDDLFSTNPNWMSAQNIRHQEVQNYIMLRLNPDVYVATDYTATVELLITYLDETNTLQTVSPNPVLTVTHDNTSGVVHQDRDAFLFNGGHDVTVQIVGGNIGFTPTSPANYDNLELVNHITVNRLFNFSGAAPNLTVNQTLAAGNQIEVNWQSVTGAEEYQLEWLHINDYEITNCSALKYNFRNNSTRITTTATTYNVSLLFEQGYVLFRVRALTLDETDLDIRIPGNWSSADAGQNPCGFAHKFNIQNFHIHEQDKLNWQYSASYAEEGKKKEVVTYFDGSLRSHQVVTRINTDNQAIVGETFYDHQGRAAVQALPAPVSDPNGNKIAVLGFYENFNKAQSDSKGYNRKHFDITQNACETLADPMTKNAGASRYYSPNNPDKSGHQAYVPDAELYPFTHVEYEPDNTGRIRRQSGVGPTHKLGGKDTKYFYGKPSQEELNRLFASEVGYNEHYKKNMVIDPNGQVSVSYMDQQGRTIATALAGDKPDNLEALASNGGNSTDMIIDILDNQPVQPGVEPLSSTYHHLVTTGGAHGLHYELGCVSDAFQANGMFDTNACLNCVYDLEIDIVGECGNTFFNHIESEITISEICNNSYVVNVELSSQQIILPIGKYVISRTLQMNQEALQANTKACIKDSDGILGLGDFIDDAIAEIDFSQCEQIDCNEECADLPTLFDKTECRLDCEFLNQCETRADILIGDFQPRDFNDTDLNIEIDGQVIPVAAGQYALYAINNGTYSASNYPYSILNPNPQSPIVYYGNIPDEEYFYTYEQTNEDGITETITVEIKVLNSAGELVFPNQLSLEEFINAYEPQWGQVFVKYHPEKCQLDDCADMEASQRYDFLMTMTDSYEEAYQLGLLNPVQGTNPPHNFPNGAGNSPYTYDPFFISGGEGQNLRSSMITFLNNHTDINVNVWQLAGASAANNSATYGFNPPDICTADRMWQIFRGLYIGEKMRLHQEALNNNNQDCDPPSGKLSHFPEYEDVMSDFIDQVDGVDTQAEINALTAEAEAEIATQCTDRAQGLANTWMEKLEGCAADPTTWVAGNSTYDNIRLELINVMVATCSAEQPFGASTGATGTTYASFEEVLVGVLTSAGININCNADLINFPGANGHEYASYTAFKPIDECACEAILETNHRFSTDLSTGNLPVGVTTVEELFEYTYETEIEGYSAKICICTSAYAESGKDWIPGAPWTNNAITTALEGATEYVVADITCQNCATCTEITDAFNAYASQPWIQVTDPSTETPEEFVNRRTMAATHLNNLFNLDLNYYDYEDFINNCGIVSPSTPVCDTLTAQGEAFVNTFNRIIKEKTLDDVNCLCVDPFLEPYAPELAEVLNLNYNNTEYCHDIYTPNSITPTSINITVQSATGQTCNWSISFIEPNSDNNADYDLNNIISTLQNIRPNENVPANDPSYVQQFLADVQVLVDNELRDATILVITSVDCYTLWECITTADDMELCNRTFYLEIEDTCEEDLIAEATHSAENQYGDYIEEVIDDIENNYMEQCTPADNAETFTMQYPDNEHHYTLYYYNQAGNLTRTVPPAGVELVPPGNWAAVNADRENGTTNISTNHRMETRYKYNSLNQLTHQTMPDHDKMPGTEWSTQFFYDKLGRIVASQNSKQKAYTPESRYSYTKYDELGRIVEAGELKSNTVPTETMFEVDNYPNNWSLDRIQVVKTFYDRPINDNINDEFGTAGQQNLRNRVASIIYQEELAKGATSYQSASHFSYDIHGNVKKLIQENTELAHFKGQRYKTMTYDYDLISGNVHQVNYQEGKADQFFHRYEYDGDNRITKVMTSPDGVIWDEDARYEYYQHGPLARTEIGDLRVQGCDFAYTIQGWIKGVNSNTLRAGKDIGKDGHTVANNPNADLAPDAYGYGLQYYNGDYKAIGGTTGNTASDFMAKIVGTDLDAASDDLFNGNISKMVTAINPVNGQTPFPIQGNAYKYDQLNRILSSNSFRGNAYSTNSFGNASDNQDYHTQYTYDANGNILSLLRNASGNTPQEQAMDNLTYHYEKDANGKIIRNRLRHVDDAVNASNHSNDIDDQNPDNYEYDEIGNLTGDNAEDIKEIVWRVDGKVERVIREAGSPKPDLLFKYDPSGNRITKAVLHKNPAVGEPDVTYTHYVRDASGNTMAVYKRAQEVKANAQIQDHLTLNEQHLYGSSRLGLRSVDNTLNNSTYENLGLNLGEYQLGNRTGGTLGKWRAYRSHRPLGAKTYEFSNHLGNVLTTVSDRKLWSGSTRIADVKSASDYYPFGMEMADRTMSVAGYRYGFNGKEKDPSGEWGSQAIYDYGFRIYNPGLGKFLSVDPLTDGYPELTPYQFAGNMPISNIDLDGLENLYYTIKFEEDGTSKLKLINRWDGLACNCNGLNVHLVANGKAYRIAGNLYGDRYGKAAKVLDEYRALTEDQLNNRIASMESVGEKREREAKEKQDLIEEYAMAGRGRGMVRSQAKSKPKPIKTTISKPKVQVIQGVTPEQFGAVSKLIRGKVGHLTNNIVVQGSRASHTARKDSDIDIAIKVSPKKFDELMKKSFGTPNPGSAKERTMLHAVKTGKITTGDAKGLGLRELKKQVSDKLGGMKVDLSIIKSGGKFDNGTQVPLKR